MEGNKTLILENARKMVGQKFWSGRFTCIDFHETEVNYRFQFRDNQAKAMRVIWIELSKFGKWDTHYQKWMYRINGYEHYVSADWFTFDNAIKSFGERLKEYR